PAPLPRLSRLHRHLRSGHPLWTSLLASPVKRSLVRKIERFHWDAFDRVRRNPCSPSMPWPVAFQIERWQPVARDMRHEPIRVAVCVDCRYYDWALVISHEGRIADEAEQILVALLPR